MKVNGVSADKSSALFGPLVFKRGEEFLAFYAQPVWDLDEFRASCPEPENTYTRFTKNGKEADPNAPAYQEALTEYYRKRWGYVVLKSLEPSNIEWEGVSLSDPGTWGEVERELKSNLALYEFAKLMQLVDEANAIDDDKLEENAETFFQRRSISQDRKKNDRN